MNEIFGPTFAGEAPFVGRRAAFVRLSGCNLDCSWCDTPYTWDWQRFDRDAETHGMDVHDVLIAVRKIDATLVEVSGGEPLLQATEVARLADALLLRSDYDVVIETNGTRPPLDVERVRYAVSPKLPGVTSHDDTIRPDRLAEFAVTGRAIFKFVASTLDDLTVISGIVAECALPQSAVYVMPEGTDRATLAARSTLADPVLANGWNWSPRLHVELWGDERGR